MHSFCTVVQGGRQNSEDDVYSEAVLSTGGSHEP